MLRSNEQSLLQKALRKLRVDALKSNQTIGMKSPLKLMPKSPRFFVSPAFKKQKTKPFILYWSMAD